MVVVWMVVVLSKRLGTDVNDGGLVGRPHSDGGGGVWVWCLAVVMVCVWVRCRHVLAGGPPCRGQLCVCVFTCVSVRVCHRTQRRSVCLPDDVELNTPML